MKVYHTENIINCRDMGGYPCREGETAYARAVRCGIPKDPSGADIQLLRETGIRTIIDLRGYKESAAMPSAFRDGRLGFDYYNISLLEANPSLTNTDYRISSMYIDSLEEYSENYARALRLVLSLDEPFLFHCFLGKDRTGLFSAILLLCAGVSREDVLRDYECSYDYIKPFAEREIAANTGLIWEQDVSRLMSERINLAETLDYLEKKYGGVEGYLNHAGLTALETAELGRILLT